MTRIDLQRAVMLQAAAELKSGWGIREATKAMMAKLFNAKKKKKI